MLAGLAVAPALPAVKVAPALASMPVAQWSASAASWGAMSSNLARYEFAEYQAAIIRAIAAALVVPPECLSRDVEGASYRGAKQEAQ